jgi:hypothetical protein
MTVPSFVRVFFVLALLGVAACNRRAVVGEYRRTFDAGALDDGGLP